MTLEEFIEHCKLEEFIEHCKLEEFIEHIKLNKHLYYEEEFERIVGFLEELKALRVESKNNSKELEVYKKLLDTACDVIISIAPTYHKTRKGVMENLYLIIGEEEKE